MRPPIITRIQKIIESQHDAQAQPVNAEAYETPAIIASECQELSNWLKKPVVLLGKLGDRHTFQPQRNRK